MPHTTRHLLASALTALATTAALSACGTGGDAETGDTESGDAGPGGATSAERAAGETSSSSTSSSPSPTPTSPPSPLPPVVSVTPGPSPTRDPASLPGPYVAAATWADTALGNTLEVAPTPAGRRTDGVRDAAAAWREVLALAPDADTPGMWEQFDCHWTWARLLEPDKPTWNLEPWRPVVDDGTMISERCNPGGPEV